MAQFPALPLWTDAYLADTRHLGAVEHGAYLLLLITAWRAPDCSLDNDDKLLARWASVTPKVWRRIKPTIMDFWTLEDINGRPKWVQKRLLKERSWVKNKSDKARAAGNARWMKNNHTADANASTEHMQDQCESDAPTPISIPIPTPLLEDTDVSSISPSNFENFWKQYPRKVAKKAAKRAWTTATKTTDQNLIMLGLTRFAQATTGIDKSFIPHPATWLNNERWNDEPSDIAPNPTSSAQGNRRQGSGILAAVSKAVARRADKL